MFIKINFAYYTCLDKGIIIQMEQSFEIGHIEAKIRDEVPYFHSMHIFAVVLEVEVGYLHQT